jgi:hypothetical protein
MLWKTPSPLVLIKALDAETISAGRDEAIWKFESVTPHRHPETRENVFLSVR